MKFSIIINSEYGNMLTHLNKSSFTSADIKYRACLKRRLKKGETLQMWKGDKLLKQKIKA